MLRRPSAFAFLPFEPSVVFASLAGAVCGMAGDAIQRWRVLRSCHCRLLSASILSLSWVLVQRGWTPIPYSFAAHPHEEHKHTDHTHNCPVFG